MIEELTFDNVNDMLSAIEEFYSSHEGSEILPADRSFSHSAYVFP